VMGRGGIGTDVTGVGVDERFGNMFALLGIVMVCVYISVGGEGPADQRLRLGYYLLYTEMSW
jgi:hypothetical protein